MLKIGRFEISFAVEPRSNAHLFTKCASFTWQAGEAFAQIGTASLLMTWR